MEKKQLNFSAPLLSARRYSSPLRPSREEDSNNTTIPSEQSDWCLGEVVKPGSVPFMWEQTPGKSKISTESLVQNPEDFPSSPRLPPAFLSRKSGDLSGFRTPNKFSGELNTFRSCHGKLSGEFPMLSKYPSLNDTTTTTTTNMNPSSESEAEVTSTLSDALESFSQIESSSLNCSITGLKHVAKPSIETRDRDFMIDRFLPAAKAMTLKPSQYASRKQVVAIGHRNEVRAIVPSRNVGNIVPYKGQVIGLERSVDDEGCDEKSTISVKVKACGFFPWFCSKNSIRQLNPLPPMKNGSKSVLSSASKVGNLVRNRSWRSPSPKLDKKIPSSNHKSRVEPAFKSCELQKPKLISRPMFYSGELQTSKIGSPYRNSSRRNSPSAYRNESPHTLYRKGVGFLAVPKRVNPYDESRMSYGSYNSNTFEQQLQKYTTAALEETMYIDSVNIAKVSHTILNLPKTKKQIDSSSNPSKSGRLDIMRARGMSGPLPCRSDFSEASKIGGNEKRNTCKELGFTPPLPKSPSESWLSRSLTSVSPRNSVSYSSLSSKVKSRNGSYLHYDHGR